MTKDKAQKQAVRERMAKTGERYTTARHYLLDHHRTDPKAAADDPPPAPDATTAVLPPRVAEPGMSNEAIRRGTGKTWDEWFVILDAWNGHEKKHAEIARYLHDEQGVAGWWCQNVTVGYERARGLRAVHERTDGFSVNASKTVPVPLDTLEAAFADGDQRARWLALDEIRFRSATPGKSWRFDVPADGSRVEARFTAKSPAKSSVAIQQTRLATADDVERWRAFWADRLGVLAAMLAEPATQT